MKDDGVMWRAGQDAAHTPSHYPKNLHLPSPPALPRLTVTVTASRGVSPRVTLCLGRAREPSDGQQQRGAAITEWRTVSVSV